MTRTMCPGRAVTAAIGISLVLLTGATLARQAGPVAAMFRSDQQRDASLARSFLPVTIPATGTAAFPLQVYLSAGDLERAFDRPEFRPDATIIPTNTELQIAASSPETQQVLIDRLKKQPAAMRDLENQIASRRKQSSPAAGGETGLLRIGVDTFVAQLVRPGSAQSQGSFPKAACLIATDFANGGAVDRREWFAQDRVRRGITACLDALDMGGATSLVLPLMGASSSKTQANDEQYEGQRTLKECRMINATAGIALGIHDFAARRRSLREIGVVQWDQEVSGMFKVSAGSSAEKLARQAYGVYADQVEDAFRKGLAGQKTGSADLKGSCATILNVP
jgi:hypothetical protein